MTKDQFLASQGSFISAVAAAAGCSPDSVAVLSITVYSTAGRRQQSAVKVDTQISPSVAQPTLPTSAQLTQQALDSSLKAFSLPSSLSLTVSVVASAATTTTPAAPSPAQTSSDGGGPSVGLVVGVVVGGVLLAGLGGLAGTRAWRSHQRAKDRSAMQVVVEEGSAAATPGPAQQAQPGSAGLRQTAGGGGSVDPTGVPVEWVASTLAGARAEPGLSEGTAVAVAPRAGGADPDQTATPPAWWGSTGAAPVQPLPEPAMWGYTSYYSADLIFPEQAAV
jgi:hypothetical protein